MSERDAELELHDAMSQFAMDPEGFVDFAYQWPIHGETGPDVWQRENLRWIGEQVRANKFNGVDAVMPLRDIVTSGHGPGKTAEGGWIVDWLMSTRRNCRGTVTANTNHQLETKTWAGIREWTARCITAHWFEINNNIMFRKGHRATWFCSPASCKEENSEAFAGQHAKDSTSFYYFDEGAAIADKIFEVAEGGLTDGEPMFFVRGNPTRNTGAFYKAAFGKDRNRWNVTVLDTRTCKFSNKRLIDQWLNDYGEDSDFFRVRVRGLPPLADELQFIGGDLVAGAQVRVVEAFPDEPVIAGVDVSGGGSAWTVCRFRKGLDARSILPIRISGEKSKDRSLIVSQLANAITEHHVSAMFIDMAFGAAIVERLNNLGYKQVFEVNFGGPSLDVKQFNLRAYMWAQWKELLKRGSIPSNDERLATDLTGPGFHLNNKNQLILESKESMRERQVDSPDDGDALCLTWAQPVTIPRQQSGGWLGVGVSQWTG